MADLDFGFTAVDQDELTTKTGEASQSTRKITNNAYCASLLVVSLGWCKDVTLA